MPAKNANRNSSSKNEQKLCEGEVHRFADNGRTTYAYQSSHGIILHGIPATIPHTFHIFDSESGPPIGRIVRRQASRSGVAYVLYGESHNIAVAVIHYPLSLPTAAPIVLKPRNAQLVLSRGSSQEFERAVAAHLSQHQGRLPLTETELQFVFNSREPDLTEEKPSWKLPMVNDRGRLASNKNMQLLDPNGTVVCQMAASTTSVFHVDFGAPITPLVAFGFALAQINL